MYGNLIKELTNSRISTRMAAVEIDMPESTLRFKLTKGEFTISEAFSIKEKLFPYYTLKYLFSEEAVQKETA